MTTYLVPAPKEIAYTYQQKGRIGLCGHCQIKTIVETYSSYQEIPLRQCCPSSIAYITGHMLPHSVCKTFQSFGLSTRTQWTHTLSTTGPIDEIKYTLQKLEKPVLLVIGHGYLHRRRILPCSVKNIVIQHYISIRGYDETGFFIFDSSFPNDTSLARGNIYLTYDSLLSYRNRGYRWEKANLYISIQ